MGWDWRELWHRVVDLELARDIAQFADRQSIPLVITVDEVNYYSRAYPVRLDASQLDERRVKASIDALHAPPTRIIAAGNEGVAALCDMLGVSRQRLWCIVIIAEMVRLHLQ
jgi:hypothetical protein